MKKISPSVYENLTPEQRVVACIEALARDDDSEKQRLISSCPKFKYVRTDVCFSEKMEKLMGLAMAIEADLRECILKFLVIVQSNPEIARGFLQDFANVRESWKVTVAAMGIDVPSMVSAGPPSSAVFELVEVLLPEPDAKRSEILSANMLACLR